MKKLNSIQKEMIRSIKDGAFKDTIHITELIERDGKYWFYEHPMRITEEYGNLNYILEHYGKKALGKYLIKTKKIIPEIYKNIKEIWDLEINK